MRKFITFVASAFILAACLNPVFAAPAKTKTQFVAHRGFQAYGPENSLKAVRYAGKYRFDMVELDPRQTKDKYWILMHDISVDRTTDGNGLVARLRWKEIKTFHIDRPEKFNASKDKVPLYMDAVRESAKWKMGVNIDCGNFEVTKANLSALNRALIKYKLHTKSLFACRALKDVQLIYKHTSAKILYVPFMNENDIAGYESVLRAVRKYRKRLVIAYPARVLTDEILAATRKAGIKVYVTGVNDEECLQRWLSKKVDYIETDCMSPVR